MNVNPKFTSVCPETAYEVDAQFRSAFNYAAIGMALVGLDGSWIQVNDALCRIVGYSESELLGLTFQDITHPDDLEIDLAYVQQLLANQIQTYQLEKRYIHKQGHEISVLLSVSLMRQHREPLYFISQIQDISQQKQREWALKRSQEENQLLLEAISDVVLVRDFEGRCLKILSSQADVLYRPVPEMLGKTLHEVMPADEADVILGYIQQAIARQRPVRGEYSLQIADRRVYFSATFSPILLDRVLISAHDITERKRMENGFRLQSMVIENMAKGVCLLRKQDNIIVYTNPQFDRMFGYCAGELIGRNVSDLNYGSEEMSEQVANQITEQISRHNKFSYEVHNVKKDGTPFWSQAVASLFEHAEHGPVFVVAQTDITEEKQAKSDIELLQKLTLAISEAENLEAALSVLLQKVCQVYGWAYGEAWTPSPKNILECGPVFYTQTTQQADLERFKQFSKTCTFTPNVGLPGRVWLSQSPEWLVDVSKESEHCFQRQPQALECGIRAGVAIPIVLNSKVLAVLVFFKLEAAHPDQHLIQSLSTIAAQLNLVMQRKQIEDSLFQEKELAQITLHSIGDGVITTDAEGRVQYLNPVATQVTGWTQAAAQGHPITDVLCIFHEVTRKTIENPVMRALQENCIIELENDAVLIHSNGAEIPIEDSAAPIRSQQGEIVGAVMVFRDVTKSRNLSKQLSWQAQHDPLTQLVNRREFEKCLETVVQTTQLQAQTHVLCYLDLDRFKIVNDTCGHEAGDELLRRVTALFKASIRKSDTLARLGGDEFALLLHQCPIEPALSLVNQLQEQVQQFRFIWEDRSFSLGVSIGVVVIDTTHSLNVKTLLNQADAACYEAKRRGRNRLCLYQSDDEALSQQQRQLQWVNYLTKALEEDRFCLYYQSIISVVDSNISEERYEVLLRMRDESDNLIAPSAFLPSAERYNLMHLIDRWVIRTVFATQGAYYRQIWSLPPEQQANYLYTINLSGASINDDQFIDFVKHQFDIYQVPPQLICFEVTETVAISNLSKAAQFMNELKELGCRFALDDFGSGMSSFGYLKKLPVDYVKIDGTFIKEMANDSFDSAVVEAIHRVCQVIGLKTIAEFVETKDILEQLQRLKIDYAQGYGIAPPRFLTWAVASN